MLIYLDEVAKKPVTSDFSEAYTEFPVLEECAAAGECSFVSPVQGWFRAEMQQGMLVFTAAVQVQVRQACSRCLKEYEHLLDGRLHVTYCRELPEVQTDDEDEIELTPEEMGLTLFAGDEIDPREVIAEQLVLELPLRPLCSDRCAGLCPWCGSDRNLSSCDCTAPLFNSRFAALKDFKISGSGE